MADLVIPGWQEPVEAAVEALPLRFFGDQGLRRVATPIAEVTSDIVELAHRMLVTMEEEDGVGLAAPQVGHSIRMFTHALSDEAPPVLINPEFLEGRGEWVYREGCLSVPGLYYDLVRAEEVFFRAYGLDGEPFTIEATGLLGRVLLHELDHLDGILMVDRLTGDARKNTEAELKSRVNGTLGSGDPFLTGRAIPKLKTSRMVL